MADPGLFPEPEHIPTVAPVDELAGLGADARRTVRQRASIARGVHPLTGRPLLPADVGASCGDCSKRYAFRYHNRSYAKCEERGDSRGPATDCRAWWPACDLFRGVGD